MMVYRTKKLLLMANNVGSDTTVRGVPAGKIKVRRGWVWEGVSPSHTLGKKIKI